MSAAPTHTGPPPNPPGGSILRPTGRLGPVWVECDPAPAGWPTVLPSRLPPVLRGWHHRLLHAPGRVGAACYLYSVAAHVLGWADWADCSPPIPEQFGLSDDAAARVRDGVMLRLLLRRWEDAA